MRDPFVIVPASRPLPLGSMLRLRGVHFSPDGDTGAAAAPAAGDAKPDTGAAAAAAGDGAAKTDATPDAKADAGAAASGDAKPDQKAPDAKADVKADTPAAPETYDLKLPQDSPLDAAVVERTAAFARARGLSQEAAQQALEFVHQEVAAARAAELAAYQPGGAEWTRQQDAWRDEVMADARLGKTDAERQAALERARGPIRKYAETHPDDSQAMASFLDASGLGNHPAAVRFLAWVGESLAEGTLVHAGGQAGDTRSAAEVLYGATPKPQ